MHDLIQQLGWQLLFIPAAAIVLGVLLWRGVLTQRALNLGPARDLELTAAEAAAGVVLGLLPTLITLLPLGISEQTQGMLWLASITLLMLGATARILNVEAGVRKLGLVPRWPKRDLKFAILAVPCAIVLAPATTMFTLIAGQALGFSVPEDLEAGHQTLITLRESNDIAHILGIIFAAAVVAPVLEELAFRGAVQTSMLRLVGLNNRWVAVGLTAVVFGLVHVSVVTTWQVLPALIVLGFVFGYVYERTGSLFCAVLVHGGFNGFNCGIILAERAM